MPGTGKHGYTGASLYGGSYNISNGIISSGSAASNATNPSGFTVVNRNSPYGRDVSGSSSNRINNAAALSIVNRAMENGMDLSGFAQDVAGMASHSDTDYGDMIRELLAQNERNTAQSQAFAREQMDFQRRSDQAAMAWSAAEAQKNRDWQEQLSNTAHQREVADLSAAGLNPILSANQGAFTGSGATGQGFSSSGAMGNVDTSATGAIGSLMSTAISSAADAQIAKMYVDAERYSADLLYSSSRLATEAGILNNHNTTSAQKEIAYAGFANDLAKTELAGQYGLRNTSLSGDYSLQNTALNNAGMMDRTVYSEGEQNKRTTVHERSENWRTKENNSSSESRNKYSVDNGSVYSVGGARSVGKEMGDTVASLINAARKGAKNFLSKNNAHSNTYVPKNVSSMLKNTAWG